MELDIVSAPASIQAFVALSSPFSQCVLNPGQSAVDCGPVSAGGSAFLHTEIQWGNTVPGFVQVTDNCGGFFSVLFSDPFVLQADWFTPFSGGQCTIQVQAFAADGPTRTFELFVPLF